MGSTAASTSQNSRTAPPTPSSTSWSALQVCEALLHVFLRVPCWLAISRLTLAAAACTARDIAGLQPLATQPVIDALSATWAHYDTERRHLKSLKVQAVDSVAVVGGTFLLDAEIQDVDLSLPEARAHGGGLHHVRCAQQCADSALMGAVALHGGFRCNTKFTSSTSPASLCGLSTCASRSGCPRCPVLDNDPAGSASPLTSGLPRQVRYESVERCELTDKDTGAVISHMEDRRGHEWHFARLLPPELPSEELDSPWRLVHIEA